MAEKSEGSEAQRAPKPKTPSDFKNNEDFVEWSRKLYSDCVGFDTDNRKEAIEDLRFVAGEQWDEAVKAKRINEGRPALTTNRIPKFVAQLVGNRRLNETVIKAIPDNAAHKDAATVREGIIRNIQKASRAKLAFDKGFENQVYCGIGNWQVVLDYASDDVFDQDIGIEPIANALSVIWDMLSVDPTGADARFCFVCERIPRKDFEKMYPGISPGGFEDSWGLEGQLVVDGWVDKDTVRIVDFWRMRTRDRTVALLRQEDGSTTVTDVTDLPLASYQAQIVARADGSPMIREAKRKYAEMYKMCGNAVLEGPYELPITRVPVFRAMGWDLHVGDRRVRWGHVRWLRDPMRLDNFFSSAWAEKLMLWPRARWLASDKAIEGREDQFRRSHLSSDPLLVYNSEVGPEGRPQLVDPAQIDVGFVQAAEIARNNLNDVSNQHEPSFGQPSNEVSGRAIVARQRAGELTTVIYTDNLNLAIEETGKVINELIPFVYDTPRIVKILPDEVGKEMSVAINDVSNPLAIDITQGKYSITLTTGPSYATKRIEAQESMQAIINAMPESFAYAADIIAENMDWPGADKLAKRARATIPPEILGEDIPPERAQQLEQQSQMAEAAAQLDFGLKQAEINERNARADEATARAEKTRSEIGVAADKVQVDDARAAADIAHASRKADNEDRKTSLQAVDVAKGENNV